MLNHRLSGSGGFQQADVPKNRNRLRHRELLEPSFASGSDPIPQICFLGALRACGSIAFFLSDIWSLTAVAGADDATDAVHVGFGHGGD